MKRLSLVFIGVALLVCASASADLRFGAVLTGASEVPPNFTAGYGSGTATLNDAHTSLHVELFFTNLTGGTVTGAHLHEEAPGSDTGGVVINFTPFLVGNRMSADFTISQDLGNRIAATPGEFYMNVHNAQHPDGEIRGDLTPLDGTVMFSGELRGSNEVPPVPIGTVGAFVMTLDAQNNLTLEANVSGLPNASAAHIHTGIAGVTGGVLIGFASSTADFVNGRLSKTVQISSENAAALRASPQNFYFNVHTAAFPAGAIRGQLAMAKEYDVAVAGRVSNASGQTFVTDLRVFNPSFTNTAVVLVELFAGQTGGELPVGSLAVDIGPRSTAVVDDVAGAMGLTSAVGGLRVTSTTDLVVTSRIFNDQRASNNGTFGQFVPGMPRANLLRRGVLPQLMHNPTTIARTNIGIFNPNDTEVVVRLAANFVNGGETDSHTLTVQPMSHEQRSILDYFQDGAVTLNDLTLTYDASAPIIVYGSVVDSFTSDQIFVPPQPDLGEPQ